MLAPDKCFQSFLHGMVASNFVSQPIDFTRQPWDENFLDSHKPKVTLLI